MTINLVMLDNKTHANKKIDTDSTFEQVKEQHLASVVASEFTRASVAYPIVFIKDEENDTYRSVVIFGLKSGENLFYNENNWTGLYVPLCFRTYPFTISKVKDSNDMAVCFDENSPLVTDDKGEALFDSEGQPSEFLKFKTDLLKNMVEGGTVTKNFISFLQERDLFVLRTLSYKDQSGQTHEVNGTYTLDEKKLHELSDEDFLEMRKRGYLAPIYAHLSSLNQMNALVKAKLARMTN